MNSIYTELYCNNQRCAPKAKIVMHQYRTSDSTRPFEVIPFGDAAMLGVSQCTDFELEPHGAYSDGMPHPTKHCSALGWHPMKSGLQVDRARIYINIDVNALYIYYVHIHAHTHMYLYALVLLMIFDVRLMIFSTLIFACRHDFRHEETHCSARFNCGRALCILHRPATQLWKFSSPNRQVICKWRILF